MPRIYIKPGEKVPLNLTERERKLIVANTLAPPYLTELLRFGTHEGKFKSYRLTLDELEELHGYIAAEANRTKVAKRQRQLDRILERIGRVLERHTDEDIPQQESNVFPSSMPPELATAITELVSTGEFTSLDEVNEALAHLTHDQNTRGNPDFNGLSPAEVHPLISIEWGSHDHPMRLNHILSSATFLHSRFLQNARTVLTLGLDATAIKSTAAGNLNRAFVGTMLKIGVWPEGFEDRVMRYNKVVNELDVFPLHLLRINLELAGLLQKRKGFFRNDQSRKAVACRRFGRGAVQDALPHLFPRVQYSLCRTIARGPVSSGNLCLLALRGLQALSTLDETRPHRGHALPTNGTP